MWLNPRVHWIIWRLHAKIKGIILEIRKIYAFLGNSDKPTDDRKVTLPIWEKKLRKEKKPFPKLIKRNKLWQPEKVSDFLTGKGRFKGKVGHWDVTHLKTLNVFFALAIEKILISIIDSWTWRCLLWGWAQFFVQPEEVGIYKRKQVLRIKVHTTTRLSIDL